MSDPETGNVSPEEEEQIFREAVKAARVMPIERRRAVLASFEDARNRAQAVADGRLSPLWA